MKIHDHARRGDIAGVARELTAGVKVDLPEYASGPSALSCVCEMPDADPNMILFLITQGAAISPTVFRAAVQSGNIDTLRILLRFGADMNARETEESCGALTSAVYAHGSPDDASLLPLLTFLLELGADPDIVSSYDESALSVASDRGRFDAVQFLLDHGADPTPLYWTDLMRAVVLGTVEEVAALLQQGASLDDRDGWERTPWLLSLQADDLRKAQLLLAAGADRTDVGRRGKAPMHYAAEMNRPAVLKWLLAEGFDVEAADEFGTTALGAAVVYGSAEVVACLLDAGADPGRDVSLGQRPIEAAPNLTVARLLLTAGEELGQVNAEVRRELTRMTGGDPRATREQYQAGRDRKFGRVNPNRDADPFRRAMVQAGCNAYRARVLFDDPKRYDRIVWCYDRFGRTTTWLPDGRILDIAGEHEDHYDPDFCIYNDVVVFDGKGGFEILSYTGLGTAVIRMNNMGTMGGEYADARGFSHGFVRMRNGQFYNIDVPGASHDPGKGSEVIAINDLNVMTGVFYRDDSPLGHGFVRVGDHYITIDFPGAAGSSGTQCNGINNLGDIVGPYSDVNDNIHGWILHSGKFTQIDFPGAPSSECDGVNDFGTLAGQYTDSYGITHGYIPQRR